MMHIRHRFISSIGKLRTWSHLSGKTTDNRCHPSLILQQGRHKKHEHRHVYASKACGYHGNPKSLMSISTSSEIWMNSRELPYKMGRSHNLHRELINGNFIVPHQCRQHHYHTDERCGISTSSVERFILGNSEISRDHLTPEIALRLMTPSCSLWDSPFEESSGVLEEHGISDPFWAFYWPGGQALTRYLLDHPSIVHGKRILDVGSGCGASAIAAAMCEAQSVLANDIDAVAVQAIKSNAALNNVTIATTTRNLIGCPNNKWDVVFLGDMFYDREFTDTVVDWLKYLSDHGTEVLIGDPGRIYLQDHPIKELLTNIYKVDLSERCRMENSGMTEGFVWKLCQPRS